LKHTNGEFDRKPFVLLPWHNQSNAEVRLNACRLIQQAAR